MALTTRPDNNTLLKLYALYKQGTEGDVRGAKPSLFDIKGRKKFEAWETIRGKAKDEAQNEYVSLVKTLVK